jgi:hypothetical protein
VIGLSASFDISPQVIHRIELGGRFGQETKFHVEIRCHREALSLHKRRGQPIGFLLATLPPLALLMDYNTRRFGSPLITGTPRESLPPPGFGALPQYFGVPLQEGLLGVLASPSRGLFMHSPILLCAFGMEMVWREPGHLCLHAQLCRSERAP